MTSPELDDPKPPNLAELPHYLWELRDRLPQMVVYDHPKDHPDHFVARLWLTLPDLEITALVILSPHLLPIQNYLENCGMVKLDRSPGDDPVILETWI